MASLIPGFEYDIFISYRQNDNKYDGWVSDFVEFLKRELGATLKEQVSVYFDNNPKDGLLETHDVDASLKEKLRCLIFIPVISRTYCDLKSFAWDHEFKAFVELASRDRFGLRIALPNGNIATRVLPVRIQEPDIEDIRLCESVLGGALRGIDFIYRSAGVNRPLRINEDHPQDNLNKIYYRDQINKLANAIDEIISGIRKLNDPARENWLLTGFPVQNNDATVFKNSAPVTSGIKPQFHGVSGKRITKLINYGSDSLKKRKKYIFSILVIALILVFVFNQKEHIFQRKNDSARELAKTHVAAAVSYIHNKDYTAAGTELELALSADPGYSYAWSSMAALSYKQGDLKKALMQTIKAMEYDPNNSQAAYNMAYGLDDKKDYLQAIHWYREAIKIDSICKRDSVYTPACSALGRLYNSINQPIEAILILQRACRSYPDSRFNYLIYKNLGNAYFLLERTDSALKYLVLSKGIKPLEPETNLFLARAYETAGMMDRSIDAWQEYIELEKDTIKSNEAKRHLKEITIKHLQEIIR
jgi:tetratricopeptide (TPR) repeat protein